MVPADGHQVSQSGVVQPNFEGWIQLAFVAATQRKQQARDSARKMTIEERPQHVVGQVLFRSRFRRLGVGQGSPNRSVQASAVLEPPPRGAAKGPQGAEKG